MLVSIGVSASLLMAPAQAQYGGGMGGGHARRAAPASTCDTPAPPALQGLTAEQLDDRLEVLQQDLKLTAAQQHDWQAFAVAVRALGADPDRAVSQQHDLPPGGFPLQGMTHIRQAVQAARSRLAGLLQIEEATQSLFNTLNDNQRVVLEMGVPNVVAPRPVQPGTSLQSSRAG